MGKYYFKKVGAITKVKNELLELLPDDISKRDLIILCVGSDRVTGDSAGPIIGTMLGKAKLKDNCYIYGCLDDTVHAINLKEICNNIYENHFNPFVIAIDSSVGEKSDVGSIVLKKEPLSPGKALDKDILDVGDISIHVVVAIDSHFNSRALLNTPLSMVYNMSEFTTKALKKLLKEID